MRRRIRLWWLWYQSRPRLLFGRATRPVRQFRYEVALLEAELMAGG